MSFESGFMCSCDDEGKAECAEIRARAKTLVEKVVPCQDDLNFVDRMLYWLSLEGDLHIAADQWAGVGVTPFKVSDPKVLEHYAVKEAHDFQCDSIVDGLCALVVSVFEGLKEDDDAQA